MQLHWLTCSHLKLRHQASHLILLLLAHQKTLPACAVGPIHELRTSIINERNYKIKKQTDLLKKRIQFVHELMIILSIHSLAPKEWQKKSCKNFEANKRGEETGIKIFIVPWRKCYTNSFTGKRILQNSRRDYGAEISKD